MTAEPEKASWMDERTWWYERGGQQAGPVSQPELLERIRSGQLGPGALVWRAGMAGWQPVREVPELAGAAAGAPPPGPSAQPAGAPWSGALPEGMEPVSVAAVIGLGLLTLGVYPTVKFYQAALAYRALAGRPSRFLQYFWLSLGLAVAGGPLHLLGPLGIMAILASVAFAALACFEALALRAEALRRCRVAPALTPDSTHKALFVTGLLTAPLVVGLVLLLVQAVKFFRDHDAIAASLAARA